MQTIIRIVLAVLGLGVAELIVYHGLSWVEARAPGSVVEPYVVAHFQRQVKPLDVRRIVRDWWEPQLGWAPRAGLTLSEVGPDGARWSMHFDGAGARRDPGAAGPVVGAAWGDSFTACDDVDDGDAWPARLGARLGGRVINRGVPAYGLDQAVMRAEQDAPTLRPPLLVLGVFEDDLGRALGRFRPFYQLATDHVLGFKPAVRLGPDGVYSLPMPWQDPDASPASLRALALQAARGDRWAEAMARQRHPAMLEAASLLLARLTGPDRRASRSAIWRDPEGAAVADHLLDRFAALADGLGARAVVLWLPSPDTLARPDLRPWSEVALGLAARHPEVVQLDATDLVADPARWFVAADRGHLSVASNERLAEALAARLANR